MKPIIDFEECLRDSPKFRACIEDAEEDIEHLELRLDKVVKLCSAMVDSGKAFTSSKQLFINGIVDLSSYFRNDTQVASTLNKLIQALNEMLKYHSMLIDQAQRAVCKNMNSFIKNDIRGVKDTKRYFEKISDEYDQVLIRNSQVPRSKPHECEEINNNVTAIRSCFQHTALDYVHQISVLQGKKRHEVLANMLSFMHAQSTFFHQGSDLCEDIDPMMKELGVTLNKMRDESSDLEKQLQGRHSLVTQKEIIPSIVNNSEPTNDVQLDGYLFKRTSNAFKTWNRRWFVIQNNQLVYRKRAKDDNFTVMEEDLRLCSVKPANDVDRRFCFEVLSPAKRGSVRTRRRTVRRSIESAKHQLVKFRSHMLQADSDEMYSVWLSAMQAGINAAIQHTTSENNQHNENPTTHDKQHEEHKEKTPRDVELRKSHIQHNVPNGQLVMQQVLAVPGNEKCCDCKSSQACWASINLGITLCIECSGIHRSLGVHYSKVRSLTLDAWEADLVKIMLQLGNEMINKLYEANIDESVAVPASPDCRREVREAWIKAKYIQKAFVRRSSDRKPMRQHLRRQLNVRKLSLRPRPQSQSTLDDESTNGGSTAVQVRHETRTSHTNANMSRKRSAVIFPRLEGLSLMAGGDNNSQEKLDLSILDSSIATSAEDLQTSTLTSGADDSADSDNYMSCIDDAAEDDPKDPGRNRCIHNENSSLTEGDDAELSDVDENEDISPNELLHRAAISQNIPLMCEALAYGADLNWSNENDEGKTAIHQAIMSNSVMACEYLFLNGAKNNAKDGCGRTPLHLATELGNTGQVCLLLKRGADQHETDNDGESALAVAVKNANADIVTLLRLAKLNEEMKESEFGNHDETFNEVVRDFSKLASDNPEKLRRVGLQSKPPTP